MIEAVIVRNSKDEFVYMFMYGELADEPLTKAQAKYLALQLNRFFAGTNQMNYLAYAEQQSG